MGRCHWLAAAAPRSRQRPASPCGGSGHPCYSTVLDGRGPGGGQDIEFGQPAYALKPYSIGHDLTHLKSGDLSVMQMQNIVVWQCNIMSGPATDEQIGPANPDRPPVILHHAGLRLVLTVGQMSAGHARKHLAPTEVAEALRRPLNGDGSNLSVPVGPVALAPANICRPVQPDTAPKGLPDGRGNRGRQLSQPRSPGHPKVADPYIWNRVSRPPG